MGSRFGAFAAFASAGLAATGALAQTAPTQGSASTTPATPTSVTLPVPGMAAALAFPSMPYSVDLGPSGTWYIDGVLSGLGIAQSNRTQSDKSASADISNAQIILNKLDGWWQVFVQAGDYAIPDIGTPYSRLTDSSHALHDYFGALPQAYFKLQPSNSFSIEAGKLPTLIGAEDTFSFEDINIERGLLWNQEPSVSRGVQANFTKGPVAFSLSLNDGYVSNRINWLSGSVTWTIDHASTVLFAAGGNIGATGPVPGVATPTAQNNSSIYNLIYTYTAAPITITPYLQFSHVRARATIGIFRAANEYSGAILANTVINPRWQIAGRVEYVATDGQSFDPRGTNLLYGPGSGAVSLTITPTFKVHRFFVRAELSFVDITSGTAGDQFGSAGNESTQLRGLLEGGVIF